MLELLKTQDFNRDLSPYTESILTLLGLQRFPISIFQISVKGVQGFMLVRTSQDNLFRLY